jgi:predicted dehydrogenase
MRTELAWGILSTGKIAHTFADAVAKSTTGRVVAVGSRSLVDAEHFGDEFHLPCRHGSYEALLADPEVQAIYISTPHPFHAEWAIKAANAGKHVLCEKPLALNHTEAAAVIEAARQHDVFLMEAFMYRCHPQTAKLVELLQQRVIGDVRLIRASFGFCVPFDPASRLFNHALGGGAILDVGCYCVSMARLIAGVAAGQNAPAEPIEVTGAGQIGPVSRVDEYAIASLRFPGGILAELATAVQLKLDSTVKIFGSEGTLDIPAPWVPGGTSEILLHRQGKDETTVVNCPRNLYTLEVDVVASQLANRQAAFPAMSWPDTLGNMRTLDRWRAAIGLVYDREKSN